MSPPCLRYLLWEVGPFEITLKDCTAGSTSSSDSVTLHVASLSQESPLGSWSFVIKL